MVDAAIAIFVGAILGGIGSLLFIARSRQSNDGEASGEGRALRSALRRVLTIYAAIAWLCVIVAVAIGDMVFIAMTGVVAILASAGLMYRWSPRSS